ncbi:MAG: hypothetical protein IPN90_13850 [Elusimicrobia bacterium]|nr:hypothetical protein [Elusimicrobiota bacterium]
MNGENAVNVLGPSRFYNGVLREDAGAAERTGEISIDPREIRLFWRTLTANHRVAVLDVPPRDRWHPRWRF